MKDMISRLYLLVGDIFGIFVSISLAYLLRAYSSLIDVPFDMQYTYYIYNLSIYLIVLLVFNYEKIYKYRYDFWEETRIILISLAISFVIVFSILALTKSIDEYSRFVLVFSFVFMSIIIPVFKNILKKILFKVGLWKKSAEVIGDDKYVKEEIFSNIYLGYVHTSKEEAKTIFINTINMTSTELQEQLDISFKDKKEVLFIPLLQSYNFANAKIIELSNARKNIIVLENALLKQSNIFIKKASDMILSIVLFPFLIAVFMLVIFLMKKEEPRGKIFFKQKRMGQNGKEFICYKFRSMYENGDEMLEKYLKNNPDEIVCYDKYHKYKSDPRITKIGHIMRKTSLDELPQVINVLRGEMSLIGPRPYMPSEKDKIAKKVDMVLAVKPGITGLWQVSGRSDVDFHSRVDIDVWYTRNWNLWLDIVILVKTIKVVLFRSGAS